MIFNVVLIFQQGVGTSRETLMHTEEEEGSPVKKKKKKKKQTAPL